jgi:hypothetical protein
MTGYSYAGDNPVTDSDPTGLCATMDGPSGKPVCAPSCVLADTCSPSEPAQVGATTPPGDDTAAPASSPLDRPVLGKSPSNSQLNDMHRLNYHGTDEFTWAEALDWLSQDSTTQIAAWTMFCRGLAHQSVSTCTSDPFNGNSDIYHVLPGPSYQGIDWNRVLTQGLPLFAGALVLSLVAEEVAAGAALSTGVGAGAEAVDTGTAVEDDIPQTIFRTGSRTDNALTDPSGVSFRSSVSSSADGQQIFRPGEKIWAVDTDQLPDGSVVFDDNPAGHVSVFASPAEINAAVVAGGQDNLLQQLGLKMLQEFGSYRLPK